MTGTPIEFWVYFHIFIFFMLALDLYVAHPKAHAVTIREALVFSAIWIALALAFNVIVLFWKGIVPAEEFLLGYVMEKSLSVDNLFVFVLIFSYFGIPTYHQHRVLFWGILGALVMRGLFIAAGVVLLHYFHWTIYVFGAFLVYTGVKLLAKKSDDQMDPERNPLVRLFRRYFPVTNGLRGQRMFVRENGRLTATPLFIVLLVVESSDVLFAVDSIPAIFGVTRDPFIIYTSNVFAILGLRSLYFLLAGMLNHFAYLSYGISVVLVFIGLKMLLVDIFPISSGVSLLFVGAILATSILFSLWRSPLPDEAEAPLDPPTGPPD